jgi:hypothetical protein
MKIGLLVLNPLSPSSTSVVDERCAHVEEPQQHLVYIRVYFVEAQTGCVFDYPGPKLFQKEKNACRKRDQVLIRRLCVWELQGSSCFTTGQGSGSSNRGQGLGRMGCVAWVHFRSLQKPSKSSALHDQSACRWLR